MTALFKLQWANRAYLAARNASREDAANVGVAAGLQGQAVDDPVHALLLLLRASTMVYTSALSSQSAAGTQNAFNITMWVWCSTECGFVAA